MSAERVEDVEYESPPSYWDVQRLVALLNGSSGLGAPVNLTDYRGASYGLSVQSDGALAQFLAAAGTNVLSIDEAGITGDVPASLSDTLDVAGDTSVGGNTVLAGTLGVTGASTLGVLAAGASTLASLGVTNNATVGGTLGVTGATTLAALTAANTLINGTFRATGAGDFDTTLNVDGVATFQAGLLVPAGASTFTGNVRFDGGVGFGVAPVTLGGTWTQPVAGVGYIVDDDIAARTATADAGTINDAPSLAAAARLSDTQALRTVVNQIRADQTEIWNTFNTLVAQIKAVGLIK